MSPQYSSFHALEPEEDVTLKVALHDVLAYDVIIKFMGEAPLELDKSTQDTAVVTLGKGKDVVKKPQPLICSITAVKKTHEKDPTVTYELTGTVTTVEPENISGAPMDEQTFQFTKLLHFKLQPSD